MTISDRVLKHFNKHTIKSINPDECWKWDGTKFTFGYGRISSGTGDSRTYHYAHRVSFEIHNGPIPIGLVIRHTCDNPECNNPRHLISGTPRDNSKDRADRGRVNSLLGESHQNAKLTNEQVIEIYNSQGRLSREYFAEKYGVHIDTISKIRNNKMWTHITSKLNNNVINENLTDRLNKLKNRG